MKQAITQQQWDELTAEQHTKYIEWTVKKSQETGDYTTVYRSIGHLIWFLDDLHTISNRYYGSQFNCQKDNDKHDWCVVFGWHSHYADELVNALWIAVKGALAGMVEEAQS